MIKHILIKINWILEEQFGLNIRRLGQAFFKLPEYILDYRKFSRLYRGRIELKPCLFDNVSQDNQVLNEYFWQDLYVAQQIFQKAPKRHVDIGSRLDGFVGHIAAFRQLEVIDIRANNTVIPNVTYRQLDITKIDLNKTPCDLTGLQCDSLSCLHVIEHFGLGRYGDEISLDGLQSGLRSLSQLLLKDGILYLSTPIGKEKVEFNANWIFSPYSVIEIAKSHGLVLFKLTVVNSSKASVDLDIRTSLSSLENEDYQLGIFEFKKA